MKAYRPTPYCIANPVRIRIDGVEVGVGATIEVTPQAPALPYTVPEATPEQYEILFHRGHKQRIYEHDNQQGRKAKTSKPNTSKPRH
jgi:hypothetical protein